MFRFLKKLFSGPKEEEVEKESISVDELSNWFDNKSKGIFRDLDFMIDDLRNKIKEETAETKDNLAILGSASLHNPKITVREIQFMEGNRKAYILAVNSFLRGIDLDKSDYSALLEFCENFNFKLVQFSRSTIRPYHILKEFFANEGKSVSINIKNLESFVVELKKSIENAGIGKINNIKNEIIDLNKRIKQKESLSQRLNDKVGIRAGLIKNRESLEKELNELIKSKEYKKLQELKADKEIISTSIKEHNSKLHHAFSVMERPFRKLSRVVMEDNVLLDNYIENPVKALAEDTSLRIRALLNKLENNLNNLTLELKDKKREKVLETVNGLTDEFLREFVNKHKELNDKLKNLEKEIYENETFKMFNKLNYELSNIKDNLEKIDSEIEAEGKELEKINIEEMKNNLERVIKELLRVEAIIS